MKTKLILVIFLLSFITSFAQKSTPEVRQNNKIVGKNYITGSDINANEYVFNTRIHHIYIDTISGYTTLQLRKLSKNGKTLALNGLIVVYDLINNKVKWTKNIDYSLCSLQQHNNILFFSKGNKLYRLNIEDGTEMWQIKSDMYYVNPKKQIGLGYKYTGLTGNIHTLEGINLETGKTLWEKELNRGYGWNQIIKVNDDDLLIVAGGLHFINMENGLGWDYETKTGKKDYTETVAKNVGGLALGLLTGTYVTSTGSNLVRDIVSNVLQDSSTIYMASKEALVSINKNKGSINWSFPLPEDLTSKSSLIINDSSLVLINKGNAYFNNKLIDFGEPFLVNVNKTTGEQYYFKSLKETKSPIVDFKIENDSLTLIFKNQIANYNLQGANQGYSKIFEEEAYGTLNFFVGNQLYSKQDDANLAFININDSIHDYVQTSKGKTLKLDQNFNVLNEFLFDNLYLRRRILNNYTFINKENQTIVLDKNFLSVGELNVNYDSFIIGNNLYQIEDNRLLLIDLSQLFKSASEDSFLFN